MAVLVFAFFVLFDVFGTVLDAAGLFLVVGSGVSAVVAGVLVDAVDRFVEGFTTALGPPL